MTLNRPTYSFIKLGVYTLVALLAFAANSVLCRLALANELIDPASFTILRLASGALTLAILISLRSGPKAFLRKKAGNLVSALALFVYAAGFSFAYLWLDTGTGALILFASVQLSMISISFFSGHTFRLQEWIGMFVALTGFVYLVLPGVSAPQLSGALLMTLAGIAWGVYSVKGKASTDALLDTAGNFIRTLPLLLLLLPFVEIESVHFEGAVYALASGILASGLGYAIWYSVLPMLRASMAAVCQLSVPVIATLGGAVFLLEIPDSRLLISSAVILGGIALVALTKRKI